MRTLFYLIGIIAILYECAVLMSTKDYINATKVVKANRKKLDNLSNNLKTYMTLQLMYFLWAVVGLFSSNYILFIAMFLLSFIPKYNSVVLKKIDALLKLGFLILILLNKFQLHIHWLSYLGY